MNVSVVHHPVLSGDDVKRHLDTFSTLVSCAKY